MSDRHLYESCPLCDAADFTEVTRADCSKHPLYDNQLSPTITWNQCRACGHIFTDGYFTEAAQSVLFSKTNDSQKVGHDMERNRVVSAKMIEKVLPYRDDGIWLEVGFGNASLLFTAQEFGFEPIGVDLRQDNVTTLQRLGIEAYCQDLSTLELSRKCAVISLMDVLEHVPYPRPFLTSVHSLLEDDGVLFLSMPNSDAMLWKLMTQQGQNPYWGELEHYHNFGRVRLHALLKQHGFTPVRYGVSERYRIGMEIVAVKRG